MYKKIKEIEKEFPQPLFRFALSHLFNVGADKLLNDYYVKDDSKDGPVLNESALDAACKEILTNTPSNSFMPGPALADTHRCAVMLAKFDVWELFKYIQTDISIGNVNVHPGTFVQFRSEHTNAEIATVILPPYADAEAVEEALDAMTSLAQQKTVRRQDILDAFHKVGIQPSLEVPCDETIYL